MDSGATCHMCNDEVLSSDLNALKRPQELSLGVCHVLEATAECTVPLQMLWPDGNSKICNLKRVLLIPKLAYNLLSVSKASDAGTIVRFDESGW